MNLAGIEHIALGDGGTAVVLPAGSGIAVDGGAGADRIYGGNAAEVLDGNAGADILVGGGGADLLRGGSGADRMEGGEGVDTASYDDSIVGVRLDLLKGTGSGGDAQGDVVAGIENVTGTSARDILSGDSLNNELRGLAGIDTLNGRSGNDRLYGGEGNDALNGSSGNDCLYGDGGNDVLVGGTGMDWLVGGAGADVFTFTKGTSGVTATTRDVITDFSGAEGDVIDLVRLDAMKAPAGDQAFHFIGNAAFSGAAGELRYFASNGNTIVEADSTGDGSADFQIELSGTHTMMADDFLL
jgi:Ca2+-binding RTX toxin-like protein